jgi:hypothetical protein
MDEKIDIHIYLYEEIKERKNKDAFFSGERSTCMFT